MLESNYQINAILQCIDIYADLDSKLLLSNNDVKRLSDYIRDQDEKIRQLRDLSIKLDRELSNMTKEIESLDL